ncbi:hypothetical protein EMIHUDRAFT_199140 [Emiliania huxleyi CCMP1516]|uniref:CobQ/CobB/MinD/ParA nucleotide binding domain-containing protein n=2 Tax=Emiliania huxleyi TaxID=2903 RepID=A0A0D3I2D2_EMIH1|nr:hypothetical protein EMIHUDRAFT_199140 [Emiliania huxleyi CCMP1516]EOD05417.1 hypothetical protein EMIHUDRAFT_199140 [Emiliania huxleyi CCMP1516]|eukprot:XP_005757846.1 hypothetical protein EMIHUDRAFT_199140 [Emiliania huxleyi CCMP1516]
MPPNVPTIVVAGTSSGVGKTTVAVGLMHALHAQGCRGATDDGSTAQVAKWLRAPVLLVVDAWNLARSAAAMVHGYQSFDPEVVLAATVFNRVAGAAHGTWIAQAMGSHPGTAAEAQRVQWE